MIGKCIVDSEGDILELQREFFRQGWIFKDEEAYKNNPSAPCYVPELFDAVYTAEDFLNECWEIQEIADELFESVDWQSPSMLLEEWMDMGEVEFCIQCQKLFWSFEKTECPYCNHKKEKESHESKYFSRN